jgi:hypothetical protein
MINKKGLIIKKSKKIEKKNKKSCEILYIQMLTINVTDLSLSLCVCVCVSVSVCVYRR